MSVEYDYTCFCCFAAQNNLKPFMSPQLCLDLGSVSPKLVIMKAFYKTDPWSYMDYNLWLAFPSPLSSCLRILCTHSILDGWMNGWMIKDG